MSVQKLGVLGGSFDPIHLSHIYLAEKALELFGLDQVLFMPAAQAPLKAHQPFASDGQRLAMVEAAIAGRPEFLISDYELRMGGTSYTYKTVQYLRTQYPSTELFWLIGSDQVAKLEHWYRIDALVQDLRFIAFRRPQEDVQTPSIAGLSLLWAEVDCPDISSTQIRECIRRKEGVDLYLPEAVKEIITTEHVYQ